MKLFILFVLSLFAFVSSLPIIARDVYVPPILTPKQGDKWAVGGKYTVTWDISNPPRQITNPNGKIYLRKGDSTFLDYPLAADFSILKGSKEVTLPSWAGPGDDYRIVLFGDSGNWSPLFSIVKL